ncbi:DUF192 domain-containing protein [Aureimonas fodinaquatilis]|uniref:DUF192 domain-containing protein n=1 Tax=Aureimonas fodinaquatilis TaxID=2565783 RepID=A0A5B0DWI8_9HYPH|nr:DUF192 domain-containing protein [Aureimonas fodinaquatilis]KAA0970728.1 DUF192 domain-containing protein [Aureimonas fodinaquatilis]
MKTAAAPARNRILVGAFAIVLAIASYFIFTSGTVGSTVVLFTDSGAHRVSVEIADTDSSRATGLMNRETLRAGHGMLFDFETPRPVTMWMKNTLIPLDMIFIGADGKITNIARNAQPLSLNTIASDGPVRFVLEINGGAAATYGAKAGDEVKHPLIGNNR